MGGDTPDDTENDALSFSRAPCAILAVDNGEEIVFEDEEEENGEVIVPAVTPARRRLDIDDVICFKGDVVIH